MMNRQHGCPPNEAHDPEKACPALDAGRPPVFRKDHAQRTTAFPYQATADKAMRRRANRDIYPDDIDTLITSGY
jgi:hypothetical protein